MRKIACLIFVLSSIIHVYTQDRLYERGTLSVGADIAITFSKGIPYYSSSLFSNKAKLPSSSFILDYKFAKNVFGLNTALELDFYHSLDSRLMYLSIPLQTNVRFGKTFEFLMAAGISNNFLLASAINQGYNSGKASDKHALGLLANIEGSYNFKNQRNKLSLNLGYSNLLGYQFDTYVPAKIGYTKESVSLSQFRLALGYKYVLFGPK